MIVFNNYKWLSKLEKSVQSVFGSSMKNLNNQEIPLSYYQFSESIRKNQPNYQKYWHYCDFHKRTISATETQ